MNNSRKLLGLATGAFATVLGANANAAPVLDSSGDFYRNDDGSFTVVDDASPVLNWGNLKGANSKAVIEGGSKLIWLPENIVLDDPNDFIALNISMGNVISGEVNPLIANSIDYVTNAAFVGNSLSFSENSGVKGVVFSKNPIGNALPPVLIGGASVVVENSVFIKDPADTRPYSAINATSSLPTTGSNVRILNSVFRDFTTSSGLNIQSGDVLVRNCVIYNNFYGMQISSRADLGSAEDNSGNVVALSEFANLNVTSGAAPNLMGVEWHPLKGEPEVQSAILEELARQGVNKPRLESMYGVISFGKIVGPILDTEAEITKFPRVRVFNPGGKAGKLGLEAVASGISSSTSAGVFYPFQRKESELTRTEGLENLFLADQFQSTFSYENPQNGIITEAAFGEEGGLPKVYVRMKIPQQLINDNSIPTLKLFNGTQVPNYLNTIRFNPIEGDPNYNPGYEFLPGSNRAVPARASLIPQAILKHNPSGNPPTLLEGNMPSGIVGWSSGDHYVVGFVLERPSAVAEDSYVIGGVMDPVTDNFHWNKPQITVDEAANVEGEFIRVPYTVDVPREFWGEDYNQGRKIKDRVDVGFMKTNLDAYDKRQRSIWKETDSGLLVPNDTWEKKEGSSLYTNDSYKLGSN